MTGPAWRGTTRPDQSAVDGIAGEIERLSAYVEDVMLEHGIVRDFELQERISAATATWLD